MPKTQETYKLNKMRDFSYKEFSGILRTNGWVECVYRGKGSHRQWSKGHETMSLMHHIIPGPVAKRLLKEAGILGK